MIEKDPSGRRERNAPCAALDQLYADVQFEIANLAAKRWLRGVQPSLGSIREAALLSNGNEITQMAKLQCKPTHAFKAYLYHTKYLSTSVGRSILYTGDTTPIRLN